MKKNYIAPLMEDVQLAAQVLQDGFDMFIGSNVDIENIEAN